MDWMFYLIVGVILFSLILVALTTRYFLTLRLRKLQRTKEQEEETRVTAEANSGL